MITTGALIRAFQDDIRIPQRYVMNRIFFCALILSHLIFSPLKAEENPTLARIEVKQTVIGYFKDGELFRGEALLKNSITQPEDSIEGKIRLDREILQLAVQLPVEEGFAVIREELGWRILNRSSDLYEQMLGLAEDNFTETSIGTINTTERLWGTYFETIGLTLELLIGDWEQAMDYYGLAAESDSSVPTARKRLVELRATEESKLLKQLDTVEGK